MCGIWFWYVWLLLWEFVVLLGDGGDCYEVWFCFWVGKWSIVYEVWLVWVNIDCFD